MADATSRRSNRLAHETSPYLLQHSHNPVDWFPWGPEALERARREGKPILLSIGYAACHWCHVMERESFEDEDVAARMNADFVCIKVDREERPDLDDIYMAATVALSGHGGWPMTVFLTPDQRPFFAGTYFPPADAHGRPGFKTVLARLAELWKTSRERLVEQAAELTEHVRSHGEPGQEARVESAAMDVAAQQLASAFDGEHGGFGRAPKFPPSASLSLLLRLHRRRPEPALLEMVTTTLDAMKNGGIYDHLGGGFARYSVDERWLVPHFEKMLYDNAQLARVYLEAWQVTGDAEYRRVAAETLDYIAREMQSPEGGYYSATDADSEGVEGKFFVWAPDAVEEVLGRPETEWFCAYYDVTHEGNFEGHSILNTPRPLADVAADLGVTPEALAESLAASRRKLYAARLRRVAPLTDDKVLASWNGLMIGTMAEGARVLGEPRYLESAERAARFVLEGLGRPDGGLYRTARAGKAHLDAYLEDYAFLGDALVDLYEAGAAERFLHEALRLAERALADFSDEASGALFQTAKGHEALIARPREGHDGAIPNANAVAARLFARLGAHTGREDLTDRAGRAVRAYGRAIERGPRAFATTLSVLDFLLEGPTELAIVGTPGAADTKALSAELGRHYLPNRIVAHLAPDERSELPLLEGKTQVSGRATLYVCRDFTCRAPVVEPGEVAAAAFEVATDRVRARAEIVAPERTAGSATAAATTAYAARFEKVHGKAAYRPLGETGLLVSRLGFGTYRVDGRVAPHRAAFAAAVRGGMNLVDTSTNYSDGASEELVGEVLSELAKEIPREAVVVVSKIGYAQGDNLELAMEREGSGRPFPEMVKYGEGLWHCIHPEWIEDQLGRSLERLGFTTLDVCLLHNPEYFLGHASKERRPLDESRTEFYRRVTEAFRQFEREVQHGRLRFYGVSSNSLGDPAGDAETTSLERFLAAAREAGGDGHHFRVIELPMNLLETNPAHVASAADGTRTVLDVARDARVAVLVNRPLNAIVEGRLIRLAEPPTLDEAPPLAEASAGVRALEAEFLKTIAKELSVPGDTGVKPEQFFRWGEQLSDFAMDVQSYEQWRDVEAHGVAPRIMQVVGALDQAVEGPLAKPWEAWRDRYLTAIEALFGAIRKRGADRSRRRTLLLGRAIDPLLPESIRGAPFSQKALQITGSVPGVTTILVGSRTEDYARDALASMALPEVESAARVLEAARGTEL